MRPLIVHEWFEKYGGSEQVVDAFAKAYPVSDLFCLWAAEDGNPPGGKVLQSILSNPVFKRNKVALLPVMPFVWRVNRSHLVEKYDFVLVSSHLFAHHFRVPKGKAKISYVHTPARYIWEPELDPRGASPIFKFASKVLKPLDRFRAGDSTQLIANSQFVADRIFRHWGLRAPVVYPPVDVGYYQDSLATSSEFEGNPILLDWRGEYVLGASRFTAQKRLDLAIWSAKWLGRPVVIAGSGPELSNLQHLAKELGVDAHFILNPSKQLLRDLYRNAVFYAYPPVEDFGIMPVEAMASGASVLGLNKGGTSETVVDGVTGALIGDFTEKMVLDAWETLRKISSGACQLRATEFDEAHFQKNLIREIEVALSKHGEI